MQSVHFTVAYWCVLVAALLPYVCAAVAKIGMTGKPASQGGYDNSNPRAWLAQQTEWRARANAAQANGFEALPFFIGAVVIAHQLGAQQGRLDLLAFFFVLLRCVYSMTYIAGVSTLRSAIWAIGLLINISILLIGYQ